MKKTLALLLLVCSLALVPQLALGQESNSNARFRKSEAAIPNSYIVVFDESVPAGRVSAFARQLANAHGGKVGFTYQTALRGFSVEMTEAEAIKLSNNPQVAFVEEDAVVEGASVQTNPTWALDRIDQRNLPLDTKYSYANAGTGVNAYVIDGGIRYTHQEFGGRAAFAYDYVVGGTGVDCNGHGTHVAGLIGGNTYGVAKGVKLWSVRVLDCNNGGTIARIIAGVDWVAGNHVKPAVANLSFITIASSPTNGTMDIAVKNLIAAGVTTVVAAGNNTGDASLRTPSRVPEAITVAATDPNDNQSPNSNFGAVVDIYAPGVDIVSSHASSDTAIAPRSGTSSSAPFVAGMAARYLSGNPQANPASVSKAITSNATPGKIPNIGSGSPNLLLYRPNAKIAFSSARDGQFEIYTINPDGTEETRLTVHDYSDDYWPEYSPDGTKIAFTSGRGDDVYYQIYVMNADGTNVRRITNNQTGHNAEAAWSPDGTQLVYRSSRDADWEIYAINVDGTNERRLTYSAGADIDPAWSPDGTKIIFPSFRDSPYNIELYTMNADGSNQVNLTNNLSGVGAHNDYYPAWSWSGAKISYVFDGGNAAHTDQIFVMNADGTGRVNLSNNAAYEYNPSWSSDDSRIVFQSGLDDGKGELYIMNSDGSNRIRITFNTGNGIDPSTADDYYPDWQAL